jgi:hypothetical protein
MMTKLAEGYRTEYVRSLKLHTNSWENLFMSTIFK